MALPAHLTVTDPLVSAFGHAQAMIERGIREARERGDAEAERCFNERREQVDTAWDAFQSAGRALKVRRIRKNREATNQSQGGRAA